MFERKLSKWLEIIKSTHALEMDLSLERVKEVAHRLKIRRTTFPWVITVAGTNGKGSCVAILEAIYRAEGYKVGAFTSPILFKYNEYVRLQGVESGDDEWCHAFELIERARGEITLTAFEFTALAAFLILEEKNLDLWILEVGLGGRYDAVNIIDTNLAIITSIGIDHVEYLGDTLEKIGYEKAGIFRKGVPVVYGDKNPPSSVVDYANTLQCPLYIQGVHFDYEKEKTAWTWKSATSEFLNLPLSALSLQNNSTSLMAVELMQQCLPVSKINIEKAIAKVNLIGRIQIMPGEITHIFDVSHNVDSVKHLSRWLSENQIEGKTYAVFSMLKDKEIAECLPVIKHFIDRWFVGSLACERGSTIDRLSKEFSQAHIRQTLFFEGIEKAYHHAVTDAKMGDRIVIFGSFHTVAAILKARECIPTL